MVHDSWDFTDIFNNEQVMSTSTVTTITAFECFMLDNITGWAKRGGFWRPEGIPFFDPSERFPQPDWFDEAMRRGE